MNLWGAYHHNVLCCTGAKREIQNKVDNALRGPWPRGWEARPIPQSLRAKKPWRPKRKRLPRFSKIGKLKHDIYIAQRKDFLREHPRCEVNVWPDGSIAPHVLHAADILMGAEQCRKRSNQVHHIRKRGRWLLDKKYWLATEQEHHRWIEDNKREAERLGYLERVHEKHGL